jgi:hypothetical protein
MNEFKVGDLVKVKGENVVIEIYSIGDSCIFDKDGWSYDAETISPYKGAISVFKGDNDE